MRFLLSAIAFVTACEASPGPTPRKNESAASPPSAAKSPRVRKPDIEYVELATGRARVTDALPLVVAIHGLGDDPGGFAGLFQGFEASVRLVLPRGFTAHGGGYSWFSFRPDQSEGERAEGIRAGARRLAELIRFLEAERPTLGRPIVTGFSQGGMLSFALAVEHPDVVFAALPLGGALPGPLLPAQEPARRERPRIIAFHGTADTRVPFEPTNVVVAELRRLGFEAELLPFEGVGHGVPAAMRAAFFERLEATLRLNR